MSSEELRVVREIRSLIAHVNEQNEAEVQEFLATFIGRESVQALMAVWSMLASRETSSTGLERVAANLAVLEFGQQLERLLTQKEGYLDDQTAVD